MRDILAHANRPVLGQLASASLLVALDYDGTLAPIVDAPEQAWMRASTRALLEQVARVYPCVVISGRAQEDTMRRLRGTGVLEVIGNHGLEPWRRTEAFAARARGFLTALRPRLAGMQGVVLEDKVFTAAVHYRQASSRERARAAILAAAAELEAVRVVEGKCVVNLIPHGAPHKGDALEKARQQLGCDAALYVGDDDTDEDVFAIDDPGRLLGVRVGRSARSRAAYYVRDQARVDDLLALLLEVRPGQAS
jgi:trehalose 6-phosphate phosphatase